MIRGSATVIGGLLLAGAAQAQTALTLGEAVSGQMPATGPAVSTCHAFRVNEPGAIEITVRSDAFDPMVEVGPGRDCASGDGWRDDDGGAATGGPLDARLVTDPLPTGDYVIRALRADGRSGPYRLSAATTAWTTAMTAVRPDLVPVSFAPPPASTPSPAFTQRPPQTATVSIELDSGTARSGTLSSAGPGPGNCYLFQTRSQQDLEVIVRSEAFDPIVQVSRGRTCNAPGPYWENDNGGAASGGPGDARMVLENREPGDYAISVSSVDGLGGAYQVMAMTGTIHVVGSTALNSPTLASSRDWQAEARDRARAEVATAVYAPPPRPAGYEGLSDGDLLQTLMASVGDGPQMVERMRAMDPVARAWMRYHTQLMTTEYLAGTNTWRDANPTSAQIAQRRAAEAQAQARAQAEAQWVAAQSQSNCDTGLRAEVCDGYALSIWREYQHNRDPEAMVRNWDVVSDGIKAAVASTCIRLREAANTLRGDYLTEVDIICADFAAQARAYANRPTPPGEATYYGPPTATGYGTGNVNVRTYDSRTGAYTGSTVMSPLEAELRGVRPQ